jgi:fatty-acyl-CoA synthase
VRLHCAGTPQAPAAIRISGPWLFDGYFTGTGFEPRTGTEFDTGDIGFLVDGQAYVLGRAGDVISTGGRNLFAEDIEAVAAAAGRPWTVGAATFRLAGSSTRFGLCVESGTRDMPDPHGLARAVRAAVSAELGTRVEPILVVIPGTIPRTTSGKVQRAQTREAYTAGAIPRRRILAELA